MLIEGIDYLIRLTGGLGPKVKGKLRLIFQNY